MDTALKASDQVLHSQSAPNTKHALTGAPSVHGLCHRGNGGGRRTDTLTHARTHVQVNMQVCTYLSCARRSSLARLMDSCSEARVRRTVWSAAGSRIPGLVMNSLVNTPHTASGHHTHNPYSTPPYTHTHTHTHTVICMNEYPEPNHYYL